MPLPSSNSEKPQPLDGAPPSFAEIFKIGQTGESAAVADLKPDQVSTPAAENTLTPDEAQPEEPLPRYAAELSGAVLAHALGLANVKSLPQHFSEEDADKVVRYVEGNTKQLKSGLAREVESTRVKKLKDVDKLFNSGLEPERKNVLVRWFQDRATPADLNPSKLVDPGAEAKGNILQIFHPALFNAAMYVLILILTLLTFAYFFRGTK